MKGIRRVCRSVPYKMQLCSIWEGKTLFSLISMAQDKLLNVGRSYDDKKASVPMGSSMQRISLYGQKPEKLANRIISKVGAIRLQWYSQVHKGIQ